MNLCKSSALALAMLAAFAMPQLAEARTLPVITACHDTPAMRNSWKDSLVRGLHLFDPGNATPNARIAADILDGRLHDFVLDTADIDPNTTLAVTGRQNGVPLLSLAASACEDSIARQLVARGASLDGDGYWVPLVDAAGNGDAPLVEFLIRQGATLNAVNFDGHTALEEAVRQRQLAAVHALLKYVADVNRPIDGGRASVLDLYGRAPKDPVERAIAAELKAHGAVQRLH